MTTKKLDRKFEEKFTFLEGNDLVPAVKIH